MYFYEVAVGDRKYHGFDCLTYRYASKLPDGSLVEVQLKQKNVVGIITKSVKKPNFPTKPILEKLNTKLPKESLLLFNWMTKYYPASLGVIASLFTPNSKNIVEKSFKKNKLNLKFDNLPEMTAEQKNATKVISSSKSTCLLKGETGSGKTRVFLELTKRAIKNNQSVLILTPEIGLTPQLESDFAKVFGSIVFVHHSGLSAKKRDEIWLQSMSDTPKIIIGARSSLFLPIKNLGLIVLDECHDSSYKQEQAPYYHGLRVASKLSEITNSTCVFASATPNISDYYYAKQKGAPIIEMKKQAIKSDKTANTLVINLKNKDDFSSNPYVSNQLISMLKESVEHKKQALVFLNRRGSARLVQCQSCLWYATCSKCSNALTYHNDSYLLVCHSCSSNFSVPKTCPECKSTEIIFKNIGTKSIYDFLSTKLPFAKIQRFDSDNKSSDGLSKHYENIHSGGIDIIVGTQLITKGLDLPKLGLVAIIVADSSLYFPDFTAEENSYQLIYQVMGRVGRGHIDGSVLLQTYNPENQVIKFAIEKNWNDFYISQINQRQKYGYPPFYHLLKLTIAKSSNNLAQKHALSLYEMLSSLQNINVLNPLPSFYSKINNKYRWQIVIKAKRREKLVDIVKQLPSGWNYDIDPINLL